MRYSEEVIRQVIEANDITDVISQYVTLKKSGRNFLGCCPFHNEKTPSFSVSPDRQFYHCFGCGVGGNVIHFIRAQENLSFNEALEYLADRAGITLPKQSDPEAEEGYRKRKRLEEIHRCAANFYYKILLSHPEAQRYLYERGFSAETIKHFGMGLSPNSWNKLFQFLKSQKYSDEELLDSGLVLCSKKGEYYDRFRNRIMIPILSAHDKVIAFGGRKFTEEQEGPKYLNSPETLIFSKSYELYHLNEAKKNIENDQFIIVEGYMDVIALTQQGIMNSVAALGTAFTPYHAKTLSRYVKEVVLCFDGDQAGKNATIKAIDILKQSSLNVRIIRLNVEDDPDSFIRDKGLNAFKERIRDAMTVTEFELNCLGEQFDTGNNDGRVKYLNAVVDLLRTESNPMALELYVKKAAKEGQVSEQVLMQEITKRQRGNQSSAVFQQVPKAFVSKIPKAWLDAQRTVLRALLSDPEQVGETLSPELFSAGSLRRLYGAIRKEMDAGRVPVSMTDLTVSLTEEKDRRVLSAIAMMEESTEDLQECLNCMRTYSQAKEDQQQLRTIQQDDADEMTKLQALNDLLKQRQGSNQEAEHHGQ